MDGPPTRLTFDSPITCVIRAQGARGPAWSDRPGGLRLAVERSEGAGATELRGGVRDQAALPGVQTTHSDPGLPLLRVTCTPAPGRARRRPRWSARPRPHRLRARAATPPGWRGSPAAHEVILMAVPWYLAHPLSGTSVMVLLAERGIDVAPRTVLRWVQTFGPLLARAPVHVIIEPVALFGAAVHGLEDDHLQRGRAPDRAGRGRRGADSVCGRGGSVASGSPDVSRRPTSRRRRGLLRAGRALLG